MTSQTQSKLNDSGKHRQHPISSGDPQSWPRQGHSGGRGRGKKGQPLACRARGREEALGSRLVDGALGRPVVGGFGGGSAEGLGLAHRPFALGGHAALAGGDDLRDELLAVHAHLHGAPVPRQLQGEFIPGRPLPKPGQPGSSALQAQVLGAAGGLLRQGWGLLLGQGARPQGEDG